MSVRVLDLRSAAAFLSLSPRTIRKHLDTFPHFRSPDGGKILVRTDEALVWLERYRARPVDIEAAHKMALELVGRRRKGKGAR